MNRFYKFSHGFFILLSLSFLFVNYSYGMEAAGEAVVEGAARDVFQESLIEGLEEGAMRDAAEAVAKDMNVTLEDIGNLPEDAKVEFRNQLKQAFREMGGFHKVFPNKAFEVTPGFTKLINRARGNFADNLSTLGENKGFSEFEYDAVKKFNPELKSIDNFPVKTRVEIETTGINEELKTNFPKKEPATTKAGKDFEAAQQEYNSTLRDRNYALEKKDPALIKKAQTKVDTAEDNLIEKGKALDKERIQNEQAAQQKVSQNKIAKKKASTSGSEKDIGDARENLQESEEKLDEAKGEKTKEERKSALKEYQEASQARDGAPKEPKLTKAQRNAEVEKRKNNLKEANKKVRDAEKDVEEKQNALKAATEEEKAAAQKALDEAQEKLDTAKVEQLKARETAGTKMRQAVAKEEGFQPELKNAQEAERIAKEDLDAARKKLYESGEGSFKFNSQQRLKAVFETLKDQTIMGVIGGLAFSIPGIIIAPIQAWLNSKAERATLKKPQYFGNIWMQIPGDLISGKNDPVVAKYLYVAVPDAKSTDNKVKRNDKGDTSSYLQHAPMYMSRTEYDDYASAPITSQEFPGEMVHLNTGFHFVGDGTGDPESPVIPFLGEVPKTFRGGTLQSHLDKQAEDVLRGVSSEQYFEERLEGTKYKGSPVIADQFMAKDNEQYKSDYPGEVEGYGSILNKAIGSFANGTKFGPFSVQAFSTLSDEAQKELDIKNPPETKPWVAYGQYIYQTADTPNVKSVRAILLNDAETAEIADEIVEYVVLKNESKGAGESERLQMPDASGQPSGVATYQFNPAVQSMLSLFDPTGNTKLTSYNDQGKAFPSGLLIKDALQDIVITDQGIIEQIRQMNQYIAGRVQYGPFKIGDKTLTIQKEWADAGINIYKLAGALEGGFDDYLVPTDMKSNVVPLPGSPNFFISLVTSRVYDSQLMPYDKKHGGRLSLSYIIYKKEDKSPPLVITGKPDEKWGTPLTVGLKAPLYSLFMDPDINPNEVAQNDFKTPEDRKWYADYAQANLGAKATDESYPLAVPEQWALNRGPVTTKDGKTERVIDLLQDHKDVLSIITASYNSWKKYYKTLDPKAIERELGTFVFVPLEPYPITIRATSAADLKNGNYVYTTPVWPDEYLVMSDTPNSSGVQFAAEFSDQRYAISLSSGAVYDKDNKNPEEPIDHLENLDQIMQKVIKKQGKFLPTLEQNIKSSRTVQEKTKQQEQYSLANTFFGPFKFYIEKQDLDAQEYVYADMTPFGNPFKMNAKQLQDTLAKANYFVGIDLEEGVKNQDAKNWIYGKKLGPNTFLVLSLVTGILYDRGGGFPGYIKEFSSTMDGNLNIQEGYLNEIFNYLNTTWGKGMRNALKSRIVDLTKTEYKKLLDEKAEIEKAQDEEEKLSMPLTANLRANLDNDKAAPYVELLQKMSPPRYVKKYNNKYYTVVPADPGPKTYIDYNVGDQSKDNNVGMSYDADGNAIVRLTGWVLENARAYAGIIVKPDGSQEIDVAMDHPAIPMDRMVKLEESATEKKLTAARQAYQKAEKAAGNKSTQDLMDASRQLGFALQEHQAAQTAKDIINGLKNAGLYANYNFYYNETIGTYFIGISDTGGERYIDLLAGYQFNPDGSPRLLVSPLYYNKSANNNNKDDLLFVSEEEAGLFIAVFKNQDNEYHSWTIYDEQKAYNKETETYDRNYFTNNQVGDDGTVTYKSKDKEYIISVPPGQKVEDMSTYAIDPDRKFSLLRYFRTQDPKGGGAYVATDANELEPTFIIWDGKPDLNLQQLYYKQNLIKLSGKGDTYTGQYKENGQTRSITFKKIVKDHGKLVKAHYITITDGKNSYDFLYETSILNPQLPVTCSTDLLKKEEEIHNLNWWKQCPGGWNLNVVADVHGVNRLLMGMKSGNLKTPKMTDALKKQAGKRGKIIGDNLELIGYNSATNQYFYQLTEGRDKDWAYYQPQWKGWYVDLANGVLYSINPATSIGYYPLGSMQLSQLYLLLDRLEISIAPVADVTGEPVFDRKGNPIIDPVTKKQLLGKPGIIYRSPTVIKDEKVLNQNIIDAAKEAQKNQAVGK